MNRLLKHDPGWKDGWGRGGRAQEQAPNYVHVAQVYDWWLDLHYRESFKQLLTNINVNKN